MNLKKITAIVIIFALLFSCTTMQGNKIKNKKKTSSYYKKNSKGYSKTMGFKSNKNRKKQAGNSQFFKSVQKFGKGIGDFTYSVWKAIVKFFSDSYAYITKELDKLGKTKFMRDLNKKWG